MNQHWFRWWRQAIIWTKDGLSYWHIHASFGLKELMLCSVCNDQLLEKKANRNKFQKKSWANLMFTLYINMAMYFRNPRDLSIHFDLIICSYNSQRGRLRAYIFLSTPRQYHRWIPLKKGQWREAFVFSLICVWTIDWANNRASWLETASRSLWRHCNAIWICIHA